MGPHQAGPGRYLSDCVSHALLPLLTEPQLSSTAVTPLGNSLLPCLKTLALILYLTLKSLGLNIIPTKKASAEPPLLRIRDLLISCSPPSLTFIVCQLPFGECKFHETDMTPRSPGVDLRCHTIEDLLERGTGTQTTTQSEN